MASTNLSSTSRQFNLLCEEFNKQSFNPPGNDIVIGSCYAALHEIIKSPRIEFLFKEVLVNRQITPTHLVNLFFRAIQYMELYYLKNDRYPGQFHDKKAWEKELRLIFYKHRKLLKDLLLTKDTTTTIFQRYAGSKIVLNALFPNKKLTVADFGCGGNYGLPGFEKELTFSSINDGTKLSLASFYLKQPLHLKKGLAVDKENPEEPSAKAWRLACSFYPQELDKSANILILEAEVSGVKKVKFLQKNLTLNNAEDFEKVKKSYNAVIISTFLYQLSQPEQALVLELAKNLIKKDGVVIIQDFATVDKNGELKIIGNWFSKPYPYRTFLLGEVTNWKIKEVLRWKDGRCKDVKNGNDFEYLIRHTKINKVV